MEAKELKQYLSEDSDRVIKTLEYFNFHHFSVHTSNGEERVACALPDGDNEGSVNIYMNEYLNGVVWTRNSFKGDLFAIIEEFTDYSFKSIMNNIHALFGLDNSIKQDTDWSQKVLEIGNINHYINRKKKRKVIDNGGNVGYDKDILNKYAPYPVNELVQEGITTAVCKQFNVSTDVMSNRILFPHFDWVEHDKIVGIQGRIMNMDDFTAKQLGVSKYFNYLKGYKKEFNLYGWAQNHQNIEDKKMLIIFEGEKSVLKESTMNHGKGIGVAVGSHSISQTQSKFIIQNTSIDTEIVIAFDNDVIKDDEKFELIYQDVKELLVFRKVTYVTDITNRLLDKKDSPIDKGPKIWRALLSMRRGF